MSGCVTVTGPPCSIWRRNSGTTLPLEPSTFPNRTQQKTVSALRRPSASTIHSAIAFEAPSAVAGLTALSVETSTKRRAPAAAAAVGAHPRADRVVAHGLERVVLGQRDVLVGGRVEHDVGAEALHHVVHALRLLAVGQDRLAAGEVTLARSARARSRRGCPRRDRAAPAAAAARARSAGTARRRSSRRRRSRARCGRAGRRPPARSRRSPARARARPRPAPRAPGASGRRSRRSARTRRAACAPGCRARGTRARPSRAARRARTGSR